MRIFTKFASVVFALVAIGHLVRFILNWHVVVGPYVIPRWISICGFVVTGLLSAMLWRESKQ